MRNKKTIENYEQAKDKTLRLLTFRAHSEKELRDKLKIAGANEDDVEKVIEFCQNYNFINDLQYAKLKARDLYNLKKFGKRRIASELFSKGICQEYVDEALSEIEFDEDDLTPLVRKKLGNNFEQKNIDKCIRYFLYRGYDFNDIKKSISALKEETDEI